MMTLKAGVMTTVETQDEGVRMEKANSELHAKYLEFGGV